MSYLLHIAVGAAVLFVGTVVGAVSVFAAAHSAPHMIPSALLLVPGAIWFLGDLTYRITFRLVTGEHVAISINRSILLLGSVFLVVGGLVLIITLTH